MASHVRVGALYFFAPPTRTQEEVEQTWQQQSLHSIEKVLGMTPSKNIITSFKILTSLDSSKTAPKPSPWIVKSKKWTISENCGYEIPYLNYSSWRIQVMDFIPAGEFIFGEVLPRLLPPVIRRTRTVKTKLWRRKNVKIFLSSAI